MAAIAAALVAAALSPVLAADTGRAAAPAMDRHGWETLVRPYIAEHCLRCHGPEKQKGGLSFASFASDMLATGTADVWQEATHLI